MNRKVSHGFMILLALTPVFAILLGALFFGVILFIASFDSGEVAGPAPTGSFELRRKWGEENLADHFFAAEKWIRHNENIEADIGKVIRIAPIGGPNRYCESFSEGWASLNLQVVGEKGEGVFRISEVSVPIRGEAYIEPSRNPWRFQIYDSPK